jgi:recombination protein RecA
VKIVKNKVAAPFREAEFDIMYGQGISREGDIIDLGVAQNLVEKSGSWYSYKGDRIGQGRENARQFLKDNPDVLERLDTELRERLGLNRTQSGTGANGGGEASPSPRPAPAAATRGK